MENNYFLTIHLGKKSCFKSERIDVSLLTLLNRLVLFLVSSCPSILQSPIEEKLHIQTIFDISLKNDCWNWWRGEVLIQEVSQKPKASSRDEFVSYWETTPIQNCAHRLKIHCFACFVYIFPPEKPARSALTCDRMIHLFTETTRSKFGHLVVCFGFLQLCL